MANTLSLSNDVSRMHRMRKFTTSFLLLRIFSAVTLSQTPLPLVGTMTIEGNHFFSERRLLDELSLQSGLPFSAASLNQSMQTLKTLYHEQGFYFVRIGVSRLVYTDDSSSVDITFTIDEGERIEIGRIELEGNVVFTIDEILSQFDTRPGTFLLKKTLENDLDHLLSQYEQVGYPFASVHIANIEAYDEDAVRKLKIHLMVEEGEKVQINEIRVLGNKETKEFVIVRESGIRVGEVYDQRRIERISRRLRRMNIFSSVAEPEVYVGKNGGGLTITVVEGNSNLFDGVAGYVPGTATGEQGYFTGLVNVSMRNLFGTARKLFVRWQKDERNSQEMGLKYVEPWLFQLPLDLSGEFQQRQQETLYVRRLFSGKVDLRLTESFSVGGIVTTETVIPSTTSALHQSRTFTTGIELLYDSRDDIVSSTEGILYRNDYQRGSKTFGNNKTTVQKVSLDTEFYGAFVSRQVVAVGIHARQLTSGNIEVSDLYRFGGATTLRGYRENQFLGSRIAWTNTEYRFLLARRSYVYGFFDTGYFFLPGDDVQGISSLERFKYGYGIGVRLETSLGNIGVSVALGEGDSFSQAKVHVGLVNEF
jgi:outer membrane protein assembly factor BamA